MFKSEKSRHYRAFDARFRKFEKQKFKIVETHVKNKRNNIQQQRTSSASLNSYDVGVKSTVTGGNGSPTVGARVDGFGNALPSVRIFSLRDDRLSLRSRDFFDELCGRLLRCLRGVLFGNVKCCERDDSSSSSPRSVECDFVVVSVLTSSEKLERDFFDFFFRLDIFGFK